MRSICWRDGRHIDESAHRIEFRVKIGPIALVHKVGTLLSAALLPLGIWGLGGLAFVDAGFFPIPTTMDGAVIGYVASDHRKFLLYCLMAATASSLGSLVPYYVGRAGGELFLLKRINRGRYERMRDRFANQEFLAIMIPAMCPPPMPIKLFEFGAGVFEMKPLLYLSAVFSGKMIQFLVCALITVFYGPEIAHAFRRAVHERSDIVLAISLAIGLAFVVYLLRKLFDRRRGTQFPIEETVEPDEAEDADDATLIT
jgi:membrane protein YqaA with SNARE-associated domain